MLKPIVIFAYLIIFFSLVSSVALVLLPSSGESAMVIPIALITGIALLHVDHRLNEIEAKVDSLSAAADSSSPE